MKRLILTAAVSALALCGCRATPGFHVCASITKPPVLSNHLPVAAMDTPGVSYAVEDIQPWPRYARAPLRAPRAAMTFADPCPPCPPCPPTERAPEQLHAPKALPKGKAQHPDDCPE